MDNVFFNFFNMCYVNNWVDIPTLKQAVVKGRITSTDFKTITGTDYAA